MPAAGLPDATEELDIPKLLLTAMVPYSCLTAAMHPLNVMKTRAQATSGVTKSTMEQLRAMIGSAGVRGLFAGLGPVLAGAIPARASYIAALEGVKPPAETAARGFGLSNASASFIANGCAGLSAAMVSMLIYVPVDVVSQKLMTANAEATGTATFSGVVGDIVNGPSGWRGLYRGLGISMVIGLPAGSIWWAVYGAARSAIPDLFSPAQAPPVLAQTAAAATAAAAATVAAVAPLDTVKTHHQLAVGSAASPHANESAFALAARLIRTDGVRSLYAGSSPRFLHLALWSTCLIAVYEYLKKTCTKPLPPLEKAKLKRTLSGGAMR